MLPRPYDVVYPAGREGDWKIQPTPPYTTIELQYLLILIIRTRRIAVPRRITKHSQLAKSFHSQPYRLLDTSPTHGGLRFAGPFKEGGEPCGATDEFISVCIWRESEGAVITALRRSAAEDVNHIDQTRSKSWFLQAPVVWGDFRHSHLEIIQTICTTRCTRPSSLHGFERAILLTYCLLSLISCHSFPHRVLPP